MESSREQVGRGVAARTPVPGRRVGGKRGGGEVQEWGGGRIGFGGGGGG
jgi:hypothetical protein